MNLISIENLCVSYGAKSVLHGVDLRIDAGEVVTIVGPNGSGKTSLLRSIIGAKTPQKGTIALKPGIKIGYVPQRLNFDYSLPMTVERFMKLSNNINKRECLDALKKSGVPDIFKSQVITALRRPIPTCTPCASDNKQTRYFIAWMKRHRALISQAQHYSTSKLKKSGEIQTAQY
jgi:ABC-type Mn2+/Zn2+ transport system ATPase subunit